MRAPVVVVTATRWRLLLTDVARWKVRARRAETALREQDARLAEFAAELALAEQRVAAVEARVTASADGRADGLARALADATDCLAAHGVDLAGWLAGRETR